MDRFLWEIDRYVSELESTAKRYKNQFVKQTGDFYTKVMVNPLHDKYKRLSDIWKQADPKR